MRRSSSSPAWSRSTAGPMLRCQAATSTTVPLVEGAAAQRQAGAAERVDDRAVLLERPLVRRRGAGPDGDHRLVLVRVDVQARLASPKISPTGSVEPPGVTVTVTESVAVSWPSETRSAAVTVPAVT